MKMIFFQQCHCWKRSSSSSTLWAEHKKTESVFSSDLSQDCSKQKTDFESIKKKE